MSDVDNDLAAFSTPFFSIFGQSEWKTHCLERMQERDITIADIMNCINKGEVIEVYPDDLPHPSCLVYGMSVQDKVLHVVVGNDGTFVYFITAYFPDTIKFEEDLKTRREK